MEKLVLTISIILLLCGVKILKQNWVSPAGIYAVWNIFFIFFSVIVFGQGIEWHYGGIYWILASVLMFLAGQCLGQKVILSSSGIGQRKKNFISNFAFWVLLILCIAGFGLPLIYLTGYGYKIVDLFDISKLLELNVTIAAARYSETLISRGVIGNFLLVVTYFVCLMGGYLFLYTSKLIHKLICFFALIPVVVNMMITNTKATLIAAIFLWASGYLVANLSLNGNKNIISSGMVKKLLIIGVVCVILFDFVMMLRIGEINMNTQRIVAEKLQRYAFGNVHAFSYWFSDGDMHSYDLGSNTYMFFTNWLHITERKMGVYEEIPELRTNIFMQHRGVIADFGKYGGLFYRLLIGIISGIIWRRLQKSNSGQYLVSKVLLAGIYFSILYGFIISPWIYSSYVLAFVLFAVALLVIKKFKIGVKR